MYSRSYSWIQMYPRYLQLDTKCILGIYSGIQNVFQVSIVGYKMYSGQLQLDTKCILGIYSGIQNIFQVSIVGYKMYPRYLQLDTKCILGIYNWIQNVSQASITQVNINYVLSLFRYGSIHSFLARTVGVKPRSILSQLRSVPFLAAKPYFMIRFKTVSEEKKKQIKMFGISNMQIHICQYALVFEQK